LLCCVTVAALGLGALVGCADDGQEDACSDLRAQLDELERRFAGGDDEQSWDDVRETSDASAERDRLRAEMARAGCPSNSE
jgi:hypothetical protein